MPVLDPGPLSTPIKSSSVKESAVPFSPFLSTIFTTSFSEPKTLRTISIGATGVLLAWAFTVTNSDFESSFSMKFELLMI